MKIKKLLAVLLSVLLLFSSMSSLNGMLFASAEETTETSATITESPTAFLYDQAVALATAEGATAPTTSNNRIAITQTGAWRVASTNAGTSSYKDVTGYWLRTNNSTTIDTRYGHSTWSYTTPYIGPAYKYSDTTKKVLTTLLRPNSTTDGDRKNAFMSLYYIAETSGEYNLTDNIGGFIVRSSDASGYEVFVSILANGEEIFKSHALTRKNRIAKFDGDTFYLEKGQKLEIRFEYEYTAEKYSGDIEIDFDPQIKLIEEKVIEIPELKGTGTVSKMFYDDFVNFGPSTPYTDTVDEETGEVTRVWQTSNKEHQNGVKNSQTLVWKAQHYKNSKWSNMGYYYTDRCDTSNGSLNFAYQSGTSYSQWGRVSVRHKGESLDNPLTLDVGMPLNIYDTRNGYKGIRIAYTVEADGVYTISPDTLLVKAYPSGSNANVYVYLTVNGETVWTSDALAKLNATDNFPGFYGSLKTGDVLAICLRWEKIDSAAAYVNSNIRIQLNPKLSYLPDVETEKYSMVDSFKGLFDDILATTTSATSGTLTQPETGWTFKYGTSVSNLTTATKYSAYPDSTWGEIRLHANTTASGDWPSIKYRIGSNAPYGLMVHYRNRMSNGSINSNGYHYNFAYSFKATRQGVHVLDEAVFEYTDFPDYKYKIDGVLKIYKNGELLYTSEEIDSSNTSTIIPKMNLMLNVGDELIFYFDRLDSDTTLGYNWHTGYEYVPTITFHKNGVAIEKTGYAPENATRYYAENIALPTSVSAYIKTNAPMPGNILDSDNFSLDVLSNGNLKLTYLNGETEKEIIFPVNVKGDWNKVAVEYDSAKSVWNCLLNDVAVASVEDTDFVASGTIGKLYVGASADSYNNGSFEGEIAELTLSDGTTVTEWTLDDITTEESLISESVNAKSDCSETYLTFPNRNHRYDLYENFTVPVSTIEAWVRLKTDYADGRSAGRILSSGENYPPYSKLNIIANGKPQLTAYDGTTTQSVTFNVDIRSDEFVHLAITADTENGVYKCYIDGVLADTVESTMVLPVSTRPYLISGDYFHNNTPVNFEGDLAGIALYSDVRTEEEIIGDMYGETNLKDSDLFGKWSFEDQEAGLINQNGNGNDFHPFWENEADSVVDESYGNYSTFVFIPDTQNFTQSQGATGLNSISDWILENKDTENIVGVLGLGDITNLNTKGQWEAAKAAFDRLKGEVPYVFVQGNHDIGKATTDADGNTVYRNTTNLNTYFPLNDWKPYLTGYFEEGKIDNIYTLTEDDKGIKYMLLGLEFQPRDEVLEWANEIVAAHPDYNVIVSTHGYQQYNYTSQSQYHITSNGYADIVGTNQNTGDLMWEKFVRKHANITTVVCGHVYHEDIHVTTNIGDNGNTVTEIIANGQTTDVLMRMSGTIMIVRVSEDGTKANVNYYAPYHDHYLKDLNQFELDWNTIMPEDSEASVNGEKFATLQDAINNAAFGDEILITDNINLTSAIVVDKALTINLNGFKITSETDVFEISAEAIIKGDSDSLVTAGENSEIFTLNENGILTITGGSYTGFNPAGSDYDYVPDGYGIKSINGIYTVDTNSIIADADLDNKVTALDLTYFRNKVMGDTVDEKYFDINGDGSFNAVDIVRGKKITVQ